MGARARTLLQMRVPHAGEPVFHARARLSGLLARLGFPREMADGVLLAFSEALSNAIVYGARCGCETVEVKVAMEGNRLVVEVSDHGAGFRPKAVHLPPPDSMAEGGRGLYLMKAFMDDVQWQDTSQGTTVRMTKSRVPA